MFRTAFCTALFVWFLIPDASAQRAACQDGVAAGYACDQVDLLSHVTLSTMAASRGNDIWGWTDPDSGDEYALMGLNNGTAFVNVTDPENPVYLGKLPTHTDNSTWRDIKVYADHAFVVSEAWNHGMQVFDLTRLRGVTSPQTFSADTHYGQFGNAHNIAINEDTGFAYAVGSNQCSGGLHMVDIQDPLNPTFAGCFSADGYTHDVQCIVYDGPDAEHQGSEICFASNADTVTIVDVTDKQAPVMLSQVIYPNIGYTHQGWLTEDHRFFVGNDELDESNFGFNTRTLVFDVADLDAPEFRAPFFHEVGSIDHNLYIKGPYVFQSNYRSGLRILDATALLEGATMGSGLEAVAYFDTYPGSDGRGFDGTWSNYPFFESGIVIVSDIDRGLFVLDPNIETNPPVANEDAAPGSFVLTAAYPNPFTGRTQLTLRVAESQAVRITVYDVLGRRVADLFDGTLAAGSEHTATFDAHGMPPGTYLVRVTGESFSETRQVTLTR